MCVSRRRGGSSLSSHVRSASPRGRFPWGPPPRDAKPCSPNRRRRSSCWDPEEARPAPPAPRALGPGLPSREIVQDSPDQKREQIQKASSEVGRGGKCMGRGGAAGLSKGWGKPRKHEKPAPPAPPGGAAAAGRVAHGLARASSTDLRTPLHALQRRACSRSPCGPGSSAGRHG